MCPNQIITFTCTAYHTSVMQWLAPPTLDALSLRPADGEGTVRMSGDGVFTLTLVSVMNLEGGFADLTSTLEFLVSAVVNGTEVECRSDTQTQSIMLLIACKLNRSMYYSNWLIRLFYDDCINYVPHKNDLLPSNCSFVFSSTPSTIRCTSADCVL